MATDQPEVQDFKIALAGQVIWHYFIYKDFHRSLRDAL